MQAFPVHFSARICSARCRHAPIFPQVSQIIHHLPPYVSRWPRTGVDRLAACLSRRLARRACRRAALAETLQIAWLSVFRGLTRKNDTVYIGGEPTFCNLLHPFALIAPRRHTLLQRLFGVLAVCRAPSERRGSV